LALVIGVALTFVIAAPLVLSSSDLLEWATDPGGLGLPGPLGWLAFVALDAAAVVCVGMVTFSAYRGESAGAFGPLVWVFAFGSALANYRHGVRTPAADDEFAFPLFSLAGPLLLEVTLSRIRRWARVDAGTQMAARPRFGARWLPGVGFRSTLRAWRLALLHNIGRPEDALAFVRETDMLRTMSGVEALRFAWHALGSRDVYSARSWLAARGVTVLQADVDEATAGLPPAPRPAVAAPITGELPVIVEPAAAPAEPDLTGLSKRDAIRTAFHVLGSYDVPPALRWLAARGVEADRGDAYAVRKALQRTTEPAPAAELAPEPAAEPHRVIDLTDAAAERPSVPAQARQLASVPGGAR
jgi:hypothetical protein